MTFTHPSYILIAILAALAFLWIYQAVEGRRAGQSLRYSNLVFMIGAMQPRTWPLRAITGAWIAAVALVVFALSGPHVRASVPVRDGAVVLCIDTSGSMSTADVEPTRSQAALAAMRAFINATPQGSAIGIVSFAGDAQAIVQPTRDREQVLAALDEVPAPNGATAIGDALSLAQRILPKTGHRVVVLFTDGVNTTGADPLTAAQALAAAHVTLFTVGIGTNTGALIPGTLQEAGIDEDALRSYAQATGGAYSRADDASQLRSALAGLGRSTLFQPGTVDISLASALAGAIVMVLTFLAGMAAGRYP